LQGDNAQEARSINHAASVALPAWWYAASFLVLETGLPWNKELNSADVRLLASISEYFLAAWRAKIIGGHAFRL
jgi:hypothetical protein